MKNLFIFSLFLFFACKNEPTPSKNTTSQAVVSPKINKIAWGKLPDGSPIDLYTLKNKAGMTIQITNYGGAITSWTAPNRKGVFEDIVLGYDSLGGYLSKGNAFFGALIGRYGNRIAKGKFALEGKNYSLATNNGANHLHGGVKGYDKVVWTATPIEAENALKLTYLSKDGEEGYPGNVTMEVLYTLTEDNALKIAYRATTDKTTIINLTNHSYFNLTGMKKDILAQEVVLNADRYLPVDKGLIPTGVRPVQGTVFDFTKPRYIGTSINDPKEAQIKFGGGYDHCWILKKDEATRLQLAATVRDTASGRILEVLTTEPAIQFYTGNFLTNQVIGKKGTVYGKRMGFCLETQHYPDSPNQPTFPTTVLRVGEEYKTETVYRFSN